jgi:hypothetical protein
MWVLRLYGRENTWKVSRIVELGKFCSASSFDFHFAFHSGPFRASKEDNEADDDEENEEGRSNTDPGFRTRVQHRRRNVWL